MNAAILPNAPVFWDDPPLSGRKCRNSVYFPFWKSISNILIWYCITLWSAFQKLNKHWHVPQITSPIQHTGGGTEGDSSYSFSLPDTYQFRLLGQRMGWGWGVISCFICGQFSGVIHKTGANNLKGTFILTEKEKRANRKPGCLSQDSTGFIFQVTQV